MQRLLYYTVLLPLSIFPFWVLYRLADVLCVMISYVFPYRKQVAIDNIERAFTEATEEEKAVILRRNFRHLGDILMEGIKNMTIGRSALQDRFQIEGHDLFQQYYDEGKSLVIFSSHCANWEYLVTVSNITIPHKAVGIGMPLTNKFLDKKLNQRRARHGMKVVHAANYKEEIQALLKQDEPIAIYVLADQSPSVKNAFWSSFFGQETAFSFGGEILARQFDMPAVYLKTTKTGRGRYNSSPIVLSNEPRAEPYGQITLKYIATLENHIREQPPYWLWTHKRWKHQPPDDLDDVKENHRLTFEKRFGKQA